MVTTALINSVTFEISTNNDKTIEGCNLLKKKTSTSNHNKLNLKEEKPKQPQPGPYELQRAAE